MTLVEQIARELEPEDGWWKTDMNEAMKDTIGTLLSVFHEDDVRAMLGRLINAMKEEYGD